MVIFPIDFPSYRRYRPPFVIIYGGCSHDFPITCGSLPSFSHVFPMKNAGFPPLRDWSPVVPCHHLDGSSMGSPKSPGIVHSFLQTNKLINSVTKPKKISRFDLFDISTNRDPSNGRNLFLHWDQALSGSAVNTCEANANTVDGCEILHQLVDGLSPYNIIMFFVFHTYQQLP